MKSPIEKVRVEGPDWPQWADEEGYPTVPVYEQGHFYITRVEGEVYGVSNSWVEDQIYIYSYHHEPINTESPNPQIAHVVGTKGGEKPEEAMRALIEGLPGYLIRWAL